MKRRRPEVRRSVRNDDLTVKLAEWGVIVEKQGKHGC